jgi:hypothetical protein
MIRFYVQILLLNPNPWSTNICVATVSNFHCSLKILSLSCFCFYLHRLLRETEQVPGCVPMNSTRALERGQGKVWGDLGPPTAHTNKPTAYSFAH